VHLSPGGVPRVALESLVKPARRVGNRGVHGITNRDVRKAPRFLDIAGAVCDALVDRILVAHNARFDMDFLERAFAPLAVPSLPWICTMELHASLVGGESKLEAVCMSLGLDPPRDAHSAMDDAYATAKVLDALIDRLEGGRVDR